MAVSQSITRLFSNSPTPFPHSSSSLPLSPATSAKLPNNSQSFIGTTTAISKSHFLQNPCPRKSNRIVPSVANMADALNAVPENLDPSVKAIERGIELFKKCDIAGSLKEYDYAIELDPSHGSDFWQRGISLYYLDRFEEAAEQFRRNIANNPNDSEISIWCFLSEAHLYGSDKARKRFLKVKKDRRAAMTEAYYLFLDGSDPAELADTFTGGRPYDFFYASLYTGLYYESQNKLDEARHHLVTAAKSPYGIRSDDFMSSLAKVHCQIRKWEI